jgi:hypothetical protein
MFLGEKYLVPWNDIPLNVRQCMETEELGTDVLEGSQFHWLLWVTVRNLRRVERGEDFS